MHSEALDSGCRMRLRGRDCEIIMIISSTRAVAQDGYYKIENRSHILVTDLREHNDHCLTLCKFIFMFKNSFNFCIIIHCAFGGRFVSCSFKIVTLYLFKKFLQYFVYNE